MSGQEQNDGTMPMARVAAILDAYGADPRRWPEAERAAVEAVLARSPEARALHGAAARLDEALAASEAPAPSSALRSTILRAAPRAMPAPRHSPGTRAQIRGAWHALASALSGELGGLRPAGAVFGVALVLGAVTGGAIGSGTGENATTVSEQGIDLAQLALFDDSYGGF